jgi:hypothetical protein
MAVQIQLRNDTAANWTSANPTLAAGEVGLETDTGKLKIGTGTTAWTSLGYFQPTNLDGISDVTITSAATGQVVQYNGTTWVNSDVAISEVTGLQTALDGLVSRTNGSVTTAAVDQNVVRNVTLSTSDPTGGSNGDVWLKYTV